MPSDRSLLLQQFVEGCEAIRKSEFVRSVTISARREELREVFPLLEEIADQAGVAFEMKGTGGSVTITLTPSSRRSS
jgi:hypothetical protein